MRWQGPLAIQGIILMEDTAQCHKIQSVGFTGGERRGKGPALMNLTLWEEGQM